MTGPARQDSYRARWSSFSGPGEKIDDASGAEKAIVVEHLGSGWVQEKGSDTELVFSTLPGDGRKWTRHYDKKTCSFICQRFYLIDSALKAIDWPNIPFGE
jgi:hypothetical protein